MKRCIKKKNKYLRNQFESNRDPIVLVAKIIPCNHKFHLQCIREWQLQLMKDMETIAQSLRCPICRGQYVKMILEYNSRCSVSASAATVKQIEINVLNGFHVNSITEWYKTGEQMVQTLRK